MVEATGAICYSSFEEYSAISTQSSASDKPPWPPFQKRWGLLMRFLASPFHKGGLRGFSCTVVRSVSHGVLP